MAERHTKELHEYELDGTCTLHGDGTLSRAQEKSTVWSRPAVYRMTCGTWTPGGGLTFHLEHSDYRRGLFDPSSSTRPPRRCLHDSPRTYRCGT